ncbi:MAG: prepilin-type N-terminal cleavage/methylation domain-containing protein [Bacilli bacterium]|nr:prepilin-type N-terminal cleavage/methylation domain-containing protein [Bacilli bacterium]
MKQKMICLVNNKGLTLVELIVSISLISIILLFLYQMIATVNYDRSGQDYAINNQTQRAEIIKYINEYMIKQPKITSLTHAKYSDSRSYNIVGNGGWQIRVYDYKIELRNAYGTLEKTWTISNDNQKDGIMYDWQNVKIYKADRSLMASGEAISTINGYQFVKIVIPVKTFTAAGNFIDDIELTYMKKV